MKLEIVSFKLCPFVQRSVITLIYRGVPHEITYIDLSDPPHWFEAISPFGQVPVLRVDDEATIFESAVINEFIDEISPGSMQPDSPLQRALNRAWTEFGSACLRDIPALVQSKDESGFQDARNELRDKLLRLEGVLQNEPYFNGDQLSLVDTAYAPLFMRLDILNTLSPVVADGEFPRTSAWWERLLELPAVQQSVVPDFRDLYLNFVAAQCGFLGGLIKRAA